jgi:outer membrane lipoprotein SlyB
MIQKIKIYSTLFVFLTASCATTGDGLPSTRVITDTQGVDIQKYNQDLYDCRQYAAQVNVGGDALAGLIAGALVGAAVGAAIGNSDTAERGAGLGAVSGVTEGASEALSEQDVVIKKCLLGRGYKVLN